MKNLSYLLIFLLGCLVSYCGTEYFKEPCPQYVESKHVDSIKAKIDVKEKEVSILKEEKKGIAYTTSFKGFKPKIPVGHPKDSVVGDTVPSDCDTMAQVIYIELLKCDTINKISDKIIDNQDTIIADQKEIITLNEMENAGLKNEVKKERRKNILTRFGAGIIIVAILLLK
jgi:hypothetical protein